MLSRRRLLIASGFAALPECARAQPTSPTQAGPLTPTAKSGTGPFYPRRTIASTTGDTDLVHRAPNDTAAAGVPVAITGLLSDSFGRPIAGAVIDLWQCDARGVYRDSFTLKKGDPAFQGFGRTSSARDGGFSFLAIRPVPYPGRCPHIHIRVAAPGRQPIATEFYALADAAENERDSIFRGVKRSSPANIVPFAPDAQGLLHATFHVVLA